MKKNIAIIVGGSVIIIGTYIYLVGSKKIERFINVDEHHYLDNINKKIINIIDYVKDKTTLTNKKITDEEKIPLELNNNKFDNDMSQFLSNNDMISIEIKRLEKELENETN
tara:strand:+ start:378 stop:710 length:333 start_codon:yes stop_codon:yes gene_type:complete